MITDKEDIIIIGGGIIGLACEFEDKSMLTADLSPKAYEGFHRANAFKKNCSDLDIKNCSSRKP